MGSRHKTHTHAEISCRIGTPQRFPVKVPNFIVSNQGELQSATTLALAGWVLRTFGFCPGLETKQDLFWILIVSSNMSLACQLGASLPEPCSFGIAATCPSNAFADAVGTMQNLVSELDAVYTPD